MPSENIGLLLIGGSIAATISHHDNLSLSGSWSSPSVKGSRPPPCCAFSLTMIDEEHAVMFGGFSLALGYSADVYVLHLPTMVSGLLLHITLIVCLSAVVPVVKCCFISKTMNIDHYSDMRCTAIFNIPRSD